MERKKKKITANKEFIEFYQTQNQRDFKKLEYILDGLKSNGLNNEGLIQRYSPWKFLQNS